MSVILPVKHFCTKCGWAYEEHNSIVYQSCQRCGKLEKETLSLTENLDDLLDLSAEPTTLSTALPHISPGPPPLSSPSPQAYPRDHGMSLPPQESSIAIEELEQKDVTQTIEPSFQNVCKPFKQYKSIKNINRRSRAYSRQFVVSVNNFSAEPTDAVNVRPLVNNIVDLVKKCYESKDSSGYEELVILLAREKRTGTAWKEIADETIMELIINEVKVFYFVQALIHTFKISEYDFGNFIATPPDQGTMSLIEEALCHECMPLFMELLQLKREILGGVLESNDVPAEAQEKILFLLRQQKTGE